MTAALEGRDGATGWSVACDFDGTLTLQDGVGTILERFALPQWLSVEAEWRTGLIGSGECLDRQTQLLRVSPAKLAACVDALAVDPDSAAFFDDCRRAGVPVTIVSDGYDWVIHRVLARMGVEGVPVIANRLTYVGDDRWSVSFPFTAGACSSGVCKCAAASTARRRLHIGDGRSDACAADAAALVFAKSWLLESRQRRGVACEPFETFADVRRRFATLCVGAGGASA